MRVAPEPVHVLPLAVGWSLARALVAKGRAIRLSLELVNVQRQLQTHTTSWMFRVRQWRMLILLLWLKQWPWLTRQQRRTQEPQQRRLHRRIPFLRLTEEEPGAVLSARSTMPATLHAATCVVRHDLAL